MKAGDIKRLTSDHRAFNRRNGLPDWGVQEVLAVLEPGERACDHGFHEPVYGYLCDGVQRLLMGNSFRSRDGETVFIPKMKVARGITPSQSGTAAMAPIERAAS